MMSKESQLCRLLNHPDIVKIEIVNSNITDGKSSAECFRLVSGIPENDALIKKLRDALCR